MSALGYLKYARRVFVKRGLPLYLVFFVTERCNARCLHCLLGERGGGAGELSLDEIRKISASMGEMLFLLPTGGEPFLRDDIADIVEIFYRQNRIRNAVIPTNGYLTETILERTGEILDRCPGLDFGVDVSIDGVGELHDRIRQVPGLFARATETFRKLRELESRRDNFNVNTELTVSHYNQDHLDELYEYLKNELGSTTVFTLLTRGAPRDPEALDVDVEKYVRLNRRIHDDILRGELSGYYNFPFADLINAKRALRYRIIEKTLREKKRDWPCYAGSLGAVLFSRGDVYPCELLGRPMGNVRDAGYDFKKVWYGDEAESIRAEIKKKKCYCTYECFLTNNILFNPMMMPALLREWARLKVSRRRRPRASGTRGLSCGKHQR